MSPLFARLIMKTLRNIVELSAHGGPMVQWSALWTLNPAIRVEIPVGPMFCTLLKAEGETSSRLLCETIEAEISEAGEDDQTNEIRPCYFASVL